MKLLQAMKAMSFALEFSEIRISFADSFRFQTRYLGRFG
jgi:hypothetical protein